jgi:hypothetical protein
MAEIVRYVNAASSGGDGTTNATSGANAAYASLSAWDAAEQTNLVTDGDTHVVWCEGSTGDTTVCTVDGWTTDSTHFITIKTAGAHRHAGVWDDSAFVLDSNTTTCMVVLAGFTVVDGLQLNVGRTGGSATVLSAEGSDAPVTLINNIVRYDATGSTVNGIQDGSTAWNHNIANNLVYDMSGEGMFLRGDVADMAVYNNTVVGCAIGIHARDTGGTQYVTIKNNLVFNCTDEYYNQNGFTADSEFNASETIGEPPGTNPVEITEAGTALFVDYTNDDYHIVASTTVAGAGVDLSTDSDGLYSFDTDIDGDTRSAWDIGADEIAVSGNIITSDITEGGDTVAAAIEVPRKVTGDTTEGGDTVAASITSPRNVTANVTESGDVSTASLTSPRNVTASVTEGGDTSAASLVTVTTSAITASVTEQGDVVAATLDTVVQITANITEAGDTPAATLVGVLPAAITANISESGDAVQSRWCRCPRR